MPTDAFSFRRANLVPSRGPTARWLALRWFFERYLTNLGAALRGCFHVVSEPNKSRMGTRAKATRKPTRARETIPKQTRGAQRCAIGSRTINHDAGNRLRQRSRRHAFERRTPQLFLPTFNHSAGGRIWQFRIWQAR